MSGSILWHLLHNQSRVGVPPAGIRNGMLVWALEGSGRWNFGGI